MWYQYYFTRLHRTPVLYAVILSDSSTSTLVFQWILVLAFSEMTWKNIFIVASLCHSECDRIPLDSSGVWPEYVKEGKVLAELVQQQELVELPHQMDRSSLERWLLLSLNFEDKVKFVIRFWHNEHRVQRVVDGLWTEFSRRACIPAGLCVLGKLVKKLANHKKQKHTLKSEKRKQSIQPGTLTLNHDILSLILQSLIFPQSSDPPFIIPGRFLWLGVDRSCIWIHNENRLAHCMTTLLWQKRSSWTWSIQHLFFNGLIYRGTWDMRLEVPLSVSGASSTGTSSVSCNNGHGMCSIGKCKINLRKIDTWLWASRIWRSIRCWKRWSVATGTRSAGAQTWACSGCRPSKDRHSTV